MSTSRAISRRAHVVRIGRPPSAEQAIARITFRRTRTGALVWAIVAGATVVASAVTYASTFPTVVERQALAATTRLDVGLGIIMGPTGGIGTVGGYTVYKCYVALTTVTALWGLLAATRLLRGDEDAGRWHLLLTGATRPGRAVAAVALGIAAAAGLLFLGVVAAAMGVGQDSRVGFGMASSVMYGASITMPALVFASVGALTSQLFRTRRTATGTGLAVMGVLFVVRMTADASRSTHWLAWTTPFGWSELIRPFTVDDPWPLLPGAAATVALAGLAAALAARRDAGAALVDLPERTAPRHRGLRSVGGLSARLELPGLTGWLAGAVLAGVTLGIIAPLTTAHLPASMRDLLARFGYGGGVTAEYLAIAFLMVAAMVAALPAAQLHAAAEEEESGRLRLLLAQPLTGRGWLGTRLALAAGAMLVAGLLAAVTIWVAARSQGLDVRPGPVLEAGINVVPCGLLTLGVGAVVLGAAPRLAGATVYLLVTVSLVCRLLGAFAGGLGWLVHVSIFDAVPMLPAEAFSPARAGLTTAVAVVLCVAGVALHGRRDRQAG